MATTVTTKTGYGARLGGSFRGIVTGVVLFVAGTALLWWNEGRAVRTGGAIEEAAGRVVELSDVDSPDEAFEGKLVHATARARGGDVLSDPRFGVEAPAESIRLDSRAEIYQWVETSESKTVKKLGGSTVTTTVYDYKRDWRPLPEDSSDFREPGHDNTQILPTSLWEDEKTFAREVSFGAYRLPEGFIKSIGRAEELPVKKTAEELVALQTALFGVPPSPEAFAQATPAPAPAAEAEAAATETPNAPATEAESAASETTNAPAAEAATAETASATNVVAEAAAPQAAATATNAVFVPQKVFLRPDGTLYLGLDPSAPAIGDVRVSFQSVPDCDVSLIAEVVGDTFAPYTAANGVRFSRIATGVQTAAEMLENARQGNKVLAWILRLVGFFLLYAGVRAILNPLAVLADVVPFVGSIVSFGTGLVAAAVALPWGLVVLAVAWVRFRPLLALALVAVAVGIAAFFFLRRRRAPAA